MCSPQLIAQRVIHDFDRKPSLIRTDRSADCTSGIRCPRCWSALRRDWCLESDLIRIKRALVENKRCRLQKKCNPLSKLVKCVCTTPLREETDTRVRASASQSDPRYSLPLSLSRSPSLSLSWISDSVSSLTLPAENIIYWQFAYVGRPSAHCLPPLVDNAKAKWNPHQYYVCATCTVKIILYSCSKSINATFRTELQNILCIYLS